MIPVLSIHQPCASLIFAPAHCGEAWRVGATDDRDSDGYRARRSASASIRSTCGEAVGDTLMAVPGEVCNGQRIAIAATAKRPKDYWHHVDRDPQFPETLAPFYDPGSTWT